MNQMEERSTTPVFGMVLKSAGHEPAVLKAASAQFVLPENWHEEHQEGQLAVDVAQTEKEVVVVSTMAGAVTDRIEVYVHNDLLTIRGSRRSPLAGLNEEQFFHQECFWGKFSRTIVLPIDVKGDLATAEYKNGVLTVRVPKSQTDAKIPVVVVEE